MKSERLKDIAWTSSAETAMNPGNKVNSRFSRAFAAKFSSALICENLRLTGFC
jgi:hypothetical protein